MSEERWMPSEDEILGAYFDDDQLQPRSGRPNVEALIRRAARARAIEELEALERLAFSTGEGTGAVDVGDVYSRLFALRSEQESALSAGRGGGRKERG